MASGGELRDCGGGESGKGRFASDLVVGLDGTEIGRGNLGDGGAGGLVADVAGLDWTMMNVVWKLVEDATWWEV